MTTCKIIIHSLLFFAFWNVFSSCGNKDSNRTSLDLVRYLQDADLLTETTSIDFGDPSGQIHLEQGWGPPREDENGASTTVLQSNRATLWFYSLQSKDKRLKIRCRTTDSSTRKILLVPMINGQRLEPGQISTSFKEHEFAIPESALLHGKNQMTIQIRNRFYSEILFDHLSFSSASASTKSRNGKILRTAKGIAAPVPSQIGFYLKVPRNGALHLDYELDSSAGRAARFLVRIESDENENKTILSRNLPAGLFSRSKESRSISLSAFEDRIVRIVMEVQLLEGKAVPEQVYWKTLKLDFPADPAQKKRQPFVAQKKPNIFFYLVDALRADHLQPYGYKKSISPNIQKFAQEGVLFERAYAQSSWTRPAVASILTGLYPSSHGTMERGDMLSKSIPTMQSLLRSSGYRMYGINAQPNVGNAFGFDQNFDLYRLVADSDSDRVYQEVEQAYAKEFVTPSFTYIHVIDTHRPYSPRPEFFPDSSDCRAEKEISGKISMECAILLYDGLVVQSDYYFGVFTGLLKRKNLYDDSLIILTADHGESFMEHGMFGHGKSVYEPEIRVPLVIRFPGARFAGKRISDVVQHVDLLPTILDYASVAHPENLEGMSLLHFLNGETKVRPVYSELTLDQQNDRALVLGDYKLIAAESNSGPRYRLHHVVNDPRESKNLISEEPIRFGYMRTMLSQWMRTQQRKQHRTEKAVLDEETNEQLRGLGYVQ